MQRMVTNAIKIDGTLYKPGMNEFSEDVQKHPHFKHYVAAGRILPVKEEKAKAKNAEEMARRQDMEAKFGVKAVGPKDAKPESEEKAEEPAPKKAKK